MNTNSQWSKQEAYFAGVTQVSITTPVPFLANEFYVRSKLHRQVSLAAVNQILCCSCGYEQLHKSKDSLKACFENVHMKTWSCYIRTNSGLFRLAP